MGRAFSVTWRRWGSWRGIGNCSAGTRRKCLFNRLTEKGLEYMTHAGVMMNLLTPRNREALPH